MSNYYHEKPSSLLGIDDKYVAYCLDEACWYIVSEIKDEKIPILPTKNLDSNDGKGQFSNLYSQLGV